MLSRKKYSLPCQFIMGVKYMIKKEDFVPHFPTYSVVRRHVYGCGKICSTMHSLRFAPSLHGGKLENVDVLHFFCIFRIEIRSCNEKWEESWWFSHKINLKSDFFLNLLNIFFFLRPHSFRQFLRAVLVKRLHQCHAMQNLCFFINKVKAGYDFMKLLW